MQKLSIAKRGFVGRVAAIEGDHRFMSRITAIGISLGSVVEVVQNARNCPLLIYSRNTLIALNQRESERILLEGVEV